MASRAASAGAKRTGDLPRRRRGLSVVAVVVVGIHVLRDIFGDTGSTQPFRQVANSTSTSASSPSAARRAHSASSDGTASLASSASMAAETPAAGAIERRTRRMCRDSEASMSPRACRSTSRVAGVDATATV